MKLICDNGFNDGKYSTRKDGVNIKEYKLWSNMLRRCYCVKFQKLQPTYIGCIMSKGFKSYSYFYDWCQKQAGFKNSGWHLDKDLLFKGNREYSEDTCVFLPREINNFLETRKSKRGKFLIGVFLGKKERRYGAQIRISGKQVNIGFFDSEIEAFNSYKDLKEAYAKILANKYKGQIDDRAYEALLNFTVDVND